MSMYNLIEYSHIYSKTSGTLSWQCYIGERALKNKDYIIDFPTNSCNSISFRYKEKITWETGNNSRRMSENGSFKISKLFLKSAGNTNN